MFDVLSKGFKSARLLLGGKAELTEENLGPALREVRASLLQADVSLAVAKAFLERVKQKSLGEIVPLKGPTGQDIRVTPQDWFIKACYDELVELMGPVDTSLNLDGQPAGIMMVGLQGAGKTTTAGKLAKRLLGERKKPLLVAADIYRPAAVDQLQTLGRKLGVPVFHEAGADPVTLARKGVLQAKNLGHDVVIIDTAGRLAIDAALMQEVADIKAVVKPANVLFVVDAMIGQDAVNTAKAFDERLDFTGFILTKLDGDARGGAALSIKEVTGKPIKFLGQGEQLDQLEEFRPEGLAQRILGFGDIVGLMQDFEKHVDEKTAKNDTEKMLKGEFSYDDFVRQLTTVHKMGPLKQIFARMPILSGMMDQIPEEAFDDRELDRTMAIIRSMTRQERTYPSVIDDSRMQRIAEGCGRDLQDVRDLHDRFLQAQQMMKGLGGLMSNPDALANLAKMAEQMQSGKMPEGLAGLPGMSIGTHQKAPERPDLSAADKLARRQKQLEARRNRKRGG